ncbi:MAG TPA: aspartate--tRNA ligase [Bacillota bacterium]
MSEAIKRTSGCGELSAEDIGREVALAGWVHRRRDHGGLIFIDLRDRSGLVQLVFNPEKNPEAHRTADGLRSEFVVAVRGAVSRRDPEQVNPKLSTGEVEVFPAEIEILNPSLTPPIYVAEAADTPAVDETTRLRYRYLDLRRPRMQRNLILRHQVTMAVRNFLDRHGFLEIETPMLTKSTPEGARDYLVPSRVSRGRFFALPQSPQLFKQLLMVSGFDRYFQVVRCFRDEDLRADRQPEFTQVDVEMSFVDQDDVMGMMEAMMAEVYEQVVGRRISLPIARMTWHQAMAEYGSDKPDLRFGMPLVDLTGAVKGSPFRVFAEAAAAGGLVKAVVAPGAATWSRKVLDELGEFVKGYGAKGLAWMAFEGNQGDQIRSPIAKFFSPEALGDLRSHLGAGPGDLALFVADKPGVVAAALGALRLELGKRLDLIDRTIDRFLWVTDFPMFEYSREEDRWVAMHHPFTSIRDEDLPLLEADPGAVRAVAYDLVQNGVELGGGSIRIHRRDVQERVFAALGLSPEEVREKFGFLLEAFEYGTPPHGGIAFGLDRMLMLMSGAETIRDVIAFPKTTSASDLLTGAPSPVSPRQLGELGLAVDKPE